MLPEAVLVVGAGAGVLVSFAADVDADAVEVEGVDVLTPLLGLRLVYLMQLLRSLSF